MTKNDVELIFRRWVERNNLSTHYQLIEKRLIKDFIDGLGEDEAEEKMDFATYKLMNPAA